MFLPVETLKELTEMARDSMKPTSTQHGLGQLLVFKDKTLRYIDQPVPPALRKLNTFEAFITLVASRDTHKVDGDQEDDEITDGWAVPTIAHEGSVIYYNTSAFQYVESPGSQYGFRAEFTLVATEQWRWLQMESAKWYDQAAFARLLRITLRDCLATPTLLAVVREVKFNVNTGQAGVVQHTRQSMSRDIVEEVKGTGAIPEEVTLSVKPFENLNFISHVQCAIEIDTSTCTFRLTPFPGQMRACLDNVLGMASEAMPDVPRYYGSAK